MDIWVAVLALIGTLTGSLSGIVISAKLTNYRLEQLEKKVDKHNDFAARIPVIEEQIKVIHHRLDELERT
jgi:hypothetical protein